MTLETILRTVLHAVAWSALVAFCGVGADVGIRWILRKLGDALSETMRRHGKWAAMMLTSIALISAVVAQKANTNDASNGVSAPMMQRAGVAAVPSPSQGGRLTLTTRNLDRLVPIASGPFLIPSRVDLAAHGPWSLSFTCEGVAASAEENDVEIEGVFTERPGQK